MTEAGTTEKKPFISAETKQHWKVQVIIALFLLALGLIGLGLMDFAPDYSETYWFIAMPIFAGLSIYLGYKGAKRRGENARLELRRQAFHWVGFLVALNLVVALINSGQIERESAGLISLVILALTCYLAGIHFEPAFVLVGILLGLAAVTAAYLEEYLIIILVIVFLLGAMVVIMMRPRQKSLYE
jgi:hypothetical protein